MIDFCKSLLSNSFSLFFETIKKAGLYILVLSIMHLLYQYLIIKFFGKYVFIYNILIYPALVLFMLHFVRCALNSKDPLDMHLLIADTKRSYLPMLSFYLVFYFLRVLLGNGGSLLLFAIVYIKLPFIEASIFFDRSSLWESVKDSFRITENEVLLSMFLLVAVFMFSYSYSFKVLIGIKSAYFASSFAYSIFVDLFQILMVFFSKAYLAVLYCFIKRIR